MNNLFFDPLMHNALVSGLIMATIFSILGIFVLLRQVVFIGIAMAQAASAGVAFSLLAGSVAIPVIYTLNNFLPETGRNILWPTLFTMVSVMAISKIALNRKLPPNASIGIVFSFLWALTILFIANSGEGIAHVRNLVEGDLLIVVDTDLQVIEFLGVSICFFTFAFWRHHILISYDTEMALALGYKPKHWSVFFFTLLGLAIVISIPYAGLLAIFTWMVIPPATGLILARTLKSATIISVTISLIATICGLYISLLWDMPVSPGITISASLLATIAITSTYVGKKRTKHRQGE